MNFIENTKKYICVFAELIPLFSLRKSVLICLLLNSLIISALIDLTWFESIRTAQPSPVAVDRPVEKDEQVNPCLARPCGRYSTCRNVNNDAQCACLPGYEGIPPYCRPQCESNSDCPNNLSCVNQKCISPCINACGQNAKCSVLLHTAMCSCVDNMVGDPFVSCHVPVLYIESKFPFLFPLSKQPTLSLQKNCVHFPTINLFL